MHTNLSRRNAWRLTGVMVAAAIASAGKAEIVFVDLNDLQLQGALTLSNGLFMAQFSDDVCQWAADHGIFPYFCVLANCGFFGADESGSAERLTAGDLIDAARAYLPQTVLAGFEQSDPSCTLRCEGEPIQNEWFNPTGFPVRGYLAWGGTDAASDPHYGWIELTVEYDPAAGNSHVTLHGYAYETEANRPLTAGQTSAPCLGDLDGDGIVTLTDLSILLANYGLTGAGPEDGDLNSDSVVDLVDLSLILALFGSSC